MKLKRSLFALALTVLTFTGMHAVPSSAVHFSAQDFVTLESEPSASLVQVAPLYKTSRSYVSKVYEAPKPFELLGLNWQQSLPTGTAASLQMRFRDASGTWSNWQAVHEDQDGPEKSEDSMWSYLITPTSTAFQYRADLSTQNKSVTPKLSNISFDVVSGGKTAPVSNLSKLFSRTTSVVSREEWGADESLRLAKSSSSTDSFESELGDSSLSDDPDMKIVKRVNTDESGKPLLWPLEYPKKVKKIIIHHTDTTGSLDDEEAAIRAIYYYHAVTRGWGDIGYNYLVAPDGRVFEGRAGGDGVVAGHAKGYNTGSVGIALLGDYQDNPVPGKLMKSLEALVYEKAELWNIDPEGNSTFRGKSMPNIMGHRDVGSTACPGTYTYDILAGIREVTGLAYKAGNQSNTSKDYAYEETTDRELVTIDPNGETTVALKLKNTGTETWNKDTFITVNASSEGDSLVSIPKDSQKRTAKMQQSSVAPGKTATFTFTIAAKMNGGLASFDMTPVFNGSKKSSHYMDLGVYVELPTLSFNVASSDAPSSLKPGTSQTVTVKLKNTGNLTWEKTGEYAVKLIKSGSSSLTQSSTLATLQETSVKPGSSGTFQFNIKAPTSGGTYTLYFSPSMSNSNAIVSGSGQISLKVMETTEDALISSTSEDWDFAPGETKTVWVQVKNTSNSKWSSTGSSAFKIAMTKPAGFTLTSPKINFTTLGSGTSTKVLFSVTASQKAGTYELALRPRLGTKNLTNSAYTIKITVGQESSFNAESYQNPIRVKLTPDNAVGTPIFTSDADFAAYDGDTLLHTFSAGSRVRVTDTSGRFSLTSGSASWTATGPVRLTAGKDNVMEITTMDQHPAWNTALNDNSFRGTIEVADESGTPILINELEIEDYLKGIGEVSNSDPTEKIKTIIVLARTYATYYTTDNVKFSGKPYDLEDDPNTSQKYLGYGFESRSTHVTEAVKATEGKVVTYKGKVVIAPYFSQSDGKATKSAKSVWGWTDTPWLVSVPDTVCTDTNGTFSGHGVGLSGCGATALAEEGKTFEEIIKTYYTGVDISKL